MTTVIVWVLCISLKLASIDFGAPVLGIFFLSANNFQTLNIGIVQDKNKLFFYFYCFRDFAYINLCFALMVAIILKMIFFKFYL